MKKLICLLLLGFISEKLVSQALKDTLFFKNGSMILGEIKTIKLGVVNFDPDDANDITVELNKLKTITAPGVIFRIETTDDHVLYGKLFPNAKPGYVTIAGEKDTTEWLLEGISLLFPFKDAFGIGFLAMSAWDTRIRNPVNSGGSIMTWALNMLPRIMKFPLARPPFIPFQIPQPPGTRKTLI